MFKKIILILILILALGLRIYKVDLNPPSLSWDEVSIGYNAYSILTSGKDEHGRTLPLDTFAAYGDYKPPVPVYLTVPFVWLFGLSELAVRAPVALASFATVGLLYFFVIELLSANKYKKTIALISTFILSVSPWHINLSRAGFEATIGLLLFVLSATLFLLSKRNKNFFLSSFLPLTLAIYTFNSARYFAPFFALIMLWYCKSFILKAKQNIVIGIVAASILLLPIAGHLVSPESRLRFKEVNIFSDVDIVKLSNSRIEAAGNTWIAKIIHNRRIYYTREFFKHYLDHFEPKFLFIKGDGNPKFSIQSVGQMYIIEAIFLLIGLFAMLIKSPREALFLILWLGFAIIPAATARETPHALRILNSLPTWHIFIAYGIFYVIKKIKNKFSKLFIIITIISTYALSVVFYLHNYYNHYPIEYSGEWQYGYKQAFQFAEANKNKYQKIVVTDYIGRPYAYALFYGKYSPDEYFKTKKSYFDAAGFYHVDGFSKYSFVSSNPTEFKSDTLYILPQGSIPLGANEVMRVNLLNGNTILVGFTL